MLIHKTATVILAWATSVATQAELMQLYVVKAVGVHAWEMPLERYQYFSKVSTDHSYLFPITLDPQLGSNTRRLGHIRRAACIHFHRCVLESHTMFLLSEAVSIQDLPGLRLAHNVCMRGLLHGHLLQPCVRLQAARS